VLPNECKSGWKVSTSCKKKNIHFKEKKMIENEKKKNENRTFVENNASSVLGTISKSPEKMSAGKAESSRDAKKNCVVI